MVSSESISALLGSAEMDLNRVANAGITHVSLYFRSRKVLTLIVQESRVKAKTTRVGTGTRARHVCRKGEMRML